jgi:alanine racemase
MDLTSLAFEKSLTKHELKQIHLEFNKSRLWLGLLGENQEQGELLSATANTIIYEILTSISARVPRLYAQGGRRAR